MTGRPSAFGKQLVHIICPGAKPMQGCHCARMIFGFWEAQLGPPVKTALADMKFDATTYQSMFKLADKAWLANGGETRTPAVVAAVKENSSSATDATPQVAAFNRGRGGRGGRGSRGGGRGNARGGRGGQNNTYNNNNTNQNQSSSTNQNQGSSTNQKPHQKGPKHSDLPASASWACAQHWKKGRGAPYCSDPLVCEWSQVVAPRAPSTST